ncbi:MAG TPA: response regulator [Burkholderiaceae bacterium]|nr:response regulator [Burkholderiaceae bacterium]
MGEAVSRRRILVVDDWPDCADSLAALLDLMGYDTECAYGGQQAVEVARRFEPDTIIMDINMPVMDGFQAARLIRENLNDRQLVLVALTTTEGSARSERFADFDAHLQKPYDYERLDDLLQGDTHGNEVEARRSFSYWARSRSGR